MSSKVIDKYKDSAKQYMDTHHKGYGYSTHLDLVEGTAEAIGLWDVYISVPVWLEELAMNYSPTP